MKFLSCFFLFLVLWGCGNAPKKGNITISPYRATSRAYTIKGVRYYPQAHYELDQIGIASFYGEGDNTHGELTASGERFNAHRLTAAHKTLPLPCVVRVTNLENGRQVILRVNDRGPYKNNRIIDVSKLAAQRLGFYKKGLARVRVQALVGRSLALSANRKYRRKSLSSVSVRKTRVPRLRSSVRPSSTQIKKASKRKQSVSSAHRKRRQKRAVTRKQAKDFIFF